MAAVSEDEYRVAMLALVARARDGHANVWSEQYRTRPPLGDYKLPVALRWVEGKFVVGAYADSVRGPASGLQIGDVIVALDGAPVDSVADAVAPYYGASNDPARRREIAGSLTRGPFGTCLVTVERAGARLDVTASRDPIANLDWRAGSTHDLPGDTFKLLAEDIAYLKLSSVVQKDARRYIEKAAGTRCLVIDIRNYPSEFMPFALGRHLVDETTPFACFTRGDGANPGAFLWTDAVSIEPGPPHYQGAVVILVDETSQSQSEYTAMAMRAAPGAIVVGSTTAGADGNMSSLMLPGGLRVGLSGIGVFYPDRRPTQQIGIVPDLEVRPTIAGIRARRDEVLEAALRKVLGRDERVSTSTGMVLQAR
jgi:C-terminal processing protease CtpA/Prc